MAVVFHGRTGTVVRSAPRSTWRSPMISIRFAAMTVTFRLMVSPCSFTTDERARDLPHPPLYVAGHAAGAPAKRRLWLHAPLPDIMDGGAMVARRLWEHAGRPERGGSAPGLRWVLALRSIFWIEPLGLCPVGEAHFFVGEGIDSDSPSGLPVLSGGAGQPSHARGAPDVRVLTTTVPAGRGVPARDGKPKYRLPFLTAHRCGGRLQQRPVLRFCSRCGRPTRRPRRGQAPARTGGWAGVNRNSRLALPRNTLYWVCAGRCAICPFTTSMQLGHVESECG